MRFGVYRSTFLGVSLPNQHCDQELQPGDLASKAHHRAVDHLETLSARSFSDKGVLAFRPDSDGRF